MSAPEFEPADQTRADVVLTEAVVNHRSLMEVAVALCDADESWEHHDATDDHPCLRCKALAVRLAPWLSERDTALLAARDAEHAAEVDVLRRERDKARDAAKIATESARRRRIRAEAAEATVERVRALADGWGDDQRMAPYAWFGSELRAALDGDR